VTDPASPVFLEWENSRDATPGGDEDGDLGPEGIVYIAPEDNATENGLLVISNEVSATLSLYTIDNNVLSVSDNVLEDNSFGLYPNPAMDRVFISKPGNYVIYDLLGRVVKSVQNASYVDVADLQSGTYVVQASNGATQKLIKR
jgi:hypothetical protein